MKYVKMLGLLAVAAAALMAFAGTASATTVTSPSGTLYTGEIKASAGLTELHGEAFSVNCKTSTVHGSLTTHGSSVTASGGIATLDFAECSFPVTVLAAGTLEAHTEYVTTGSPSTSHQGTANGNGTLTSSGARITIHGPFGINCLYETNNTDVGKVTGGTTAKLDIDSSLIPRTGDSAFCGAAGEWTGSYTVNTPDTLLID